MARTRVLQFHPWQLVLAALGLAFVLMLASGTVYHFVFLKAARERWPVVSPLVRLIVRDEVAQRERFMRENLNAFAHKVGEMQAKLLRVEAMGERLQGLAGVRLDELRPARAVVPAASSAGGRGGPYLPLALPSMDALHLTVRGMDELTDFHTDYLTLVESRLLETRLRALMVPSEAPVDGPIGSGFGFRTDPFSGRAALHAGLDFPAESGTPIHAAAGGVVTVRDTHPEYGQLLEIDHGNGLATRYAHVAGYEVALGALVKRGQRVARVGSTGRSTGAHLHFEVLVNGVPQNPARFLASSVASAAPTAPTAPASSTASAGRRR